MKSTLVSSRLTEEDLESIRGKLRNDKCTAQEKRLMVLDMAYHQCTWIEIATVLGISGDAVEEKYRDVLNIAHTQFKHDFRRLQFHCAKTNKGNPTMLIWLGKQYVDQSEIPQMEMKKDQFDKFIEWISHQKTPSARQVKNK